MKRLAALTNLSCSTTISTQFLIYTAIARPRRKRFQKPEPRIRHRINDKIRASELRVVDADNELVGVMSRDEALARAKEEEVDLVEIAPKAEPPVAKLIDYGKMLYILKKKEHAAKKAGKSLEQKGIRITFRMGEGDLERQRKHAEEFLEKGHSVKVQLVMKGRENAHKDIAHEKMRAFCESLAEVGKLEQTPRGSGFQIIAILKPNKAS